MAKKQGFEWRCRYSTTDEPNKHGRWARVCYYNGVMIAWVDKEALNVETRYYINDYFPSKKNIGAPCFFDVVHDVDFETVKSATEKRFLKFLKRVK